jgi:effector-binding domain-containing protein
MRDLDVEIGFPVSGSLPGKGEIQPGEIPGGQAATTLHVGSYEELGPAYEALAQWIDDNGYEAIGVAYEMYLTDPAETPAEELKTQIVFPLK